MCGFHADISNRSHCPEPCSRMRQNPAGRFRWIQLVAVMDWASRMVLSWRLSNTLDSSFCVDALQEAIGRYGRLKSSTRIREAVYLGSVYKRSKYGKDRDQHGRQGQMDGHVFIERIWRSVKYEDIYLKAYGSMAELKKGLADYFKFYNEERWHQNFDRKTPYGLLRFTTQSTRAAEYCAT